jgi:hypothetical protein
MFFSVSSGTSEGELMGVLSGVAIGENVGVGAKDLDCAFTFSATCRCREIKDAATITNNTRKMTKPIPNTPSIFPTDDFGGG